MRKDQYEYTPFGKREANQLTEDIELHEADGWELVTITTDSGGWGVGRSRKVKARALISHGCGDPAKACLLGAARDLQSALSGRPRFIPLQHRRPSRYIPRVADAQKSEASTLAGMTDEELLNEIPKLGNVTFMLVERQMEMDRRLIVAIRAFNASSDRWAGRLFWATWALLAATLVLAVLTLVLVVKA